MLRSSESGEHRELALVEREEVKKSPALGWCLAEADTDYIDRDRFVAVRWSLWAASLG
jgi:hypothetical protein